MKYFLILLCVFSLQADIKVYVSKSCVIDKLTKQELKNLYLKKTKLFQDTKVTVLDNEEAYNFFYKEILNKTEAQMYAYWMKQVFSGKNTPPKKITDLEIEDYLKKNTSSMIYSRKFLDAKVIYEHH